MRFRGISQRSPYAHSNSSPKFPSHMNMNIFTHIRILHNSGTGTGIIRGGVITQNIADKLFASVAIHRLTLYNIEGGNPDGAKGKLISHEGSLSVERWADLSIQLHSGHWDGDIDKYNQGETVLKQIKIVWDSLLLQSRSPVNVYQCRWLRRKQWHYPSLQISSCHKIKNSFLSICHGTSGTLVTTTFFIGSAERKKKGYSNLYLLTYLQIKVSPVSCSHSAISPSCQPLLAESSINHLLAKGLPTPVSSTSRKWIFWSNKDKVAWGSIALFSLKKSVRFKLPGFAIRVGLSWRASEQRLSMIRSKKKKIERPYS